MLALQKETRAQHEKVCPLGAPSAFKTHTVRLIRLAPPSFSTFSPVNEQIAACSVCVSEPKLFSSRCTLLQHV